MVWVAAHGAATHEAGGTRSREDGAKPAPQPSMHQADICSTCKMHLPVFTPSVSLP